ncbi:MAG TPA: DUF3365 domain-containing protein [Chthonomonadales bacterium]|nr:DUF3365 domain-containing protein [Chthonomonadales bacterium]
MRACGFARNIAVRVAVWPILLIAVGAPIVGMVLWTRLQGNAARETREKADMLLATHAATIRFVNDRKVSTGATDGARLLTASSLARQIMDVYNRESGAPPYRFRIAAMNPTNPENKANAFEERLVSALEADRNLKRIDDRVEEGGVSYVVSAVPIAVSHDRCLACHGSPAKAPAWQRRRYGSTAGFGREKNQVVAAGVLYVPDEGPATRAAGAVWIPAAMLGGLLLAALVVLATTANRRIARPAREMLTTSRAIRRGEWAVRFQSRSGDEMETLAASFQDTTRWLRERVAQEEKLRAMFQQFVPASVAARALGRDAGQVIEGQKQPVTVLEINIRNFRLLQEHLPPQETVTTLNEFFGTVNRTIVEHNGIVSKYLGDTVLAFFGMPLGNGTHALDAVKAALAIPRGLQDLYVRLDEAYGWQLGVGVGIATGEPIVGHFGSSEHYEYTVLGEVVVLAHALEEISKGVPEEDTILIDEATYRAVMSDVQVCDMGMRHTASGRVLHAFMVQGMRLEARSVLVA